MRVDVYDIQRKVRLPGVGFANLRDFDLRETGSVLPAHLIANDAITLYSLDLSDRRAVFVEGRPLSELAHYPFMYLAQYEHARRVLTLSFDDFIELGATLTDPSKIVFVHSTGRAGSTLISQLLANSQNVACMSEPDVLCDLVLARFYRPENENFQRKLFTTCVRMLCKNVSKDVVAIKGRSFAMELTDWMHACFPKSRHVFVYRNVFDWIDSTMRAFPSNDTNQRQVASDAFRAMKPLVSLLRECQESERLSLAAVHALMWKSSVLRYLMLHRAGANARALDYDVVSRHPHESARALLSFLDVDPIPAAMLDEVFNRDSQANSPLARAIVKGRKAELSEMDLRDIEYHLGLEPAVSSSASELPGNLRP